jgi:diguanylate cyclase (GGDEF)-like protein/PAS domain S-box-containing protein
VFNESRVSVRDDDCVLEALLASPYLAVVGVSLSGSINRWSEGAHALLGWTSQEVLGRPLTMLSPADRQPELGAMIDAVAGGRAAPAIESVALAKGGGSVEVHLHTCLVKDDQGQAAGALALFREVGAARAVLNDTAQELHARFQRSPVAQSLVSLDARVLGVNEAMTTLLGPSLELVDANALMLLHEDDREAASAALGQVACGAEAHLQLEARLLTSHGPRLAILTGTAVRQHSGETVLAVSAQDVTDLRAAEEAVRVQAARFEAVLTTLPVVFFSYDRQGRCTFSRGQGLDALGLQQDELVGSDLLEAYADVPQFGDVLLRSLSGAAATFTVGVHGRTMAGGVRPQHDAAGTVVGGLGICIDATERSEAERKVQVNEARLHSLLQHASDVALVVDADGAIVYVSPAARLQLGHAAEDLTGTEVTDLAHPDDRSLISGAWSAVTRAPAATTSCECRVRHADGSWVWTEQIFTNLLDDPVIGGVVVNVRETTARRRVEEDLRRLALRDGLTGLANRALLLDRARHALARERRSASRTGLIVVDVVGMHAVNQQVGQDGGDEVLRELAQRLQAVVRPTDSLARVGGDHFALLVEDVASVEDLRTRVATLLEAVEDPVLAAGASVQVRLRAGSAMSPAVDAGALLAAAERSVRVASGGVREQDAADQEQHQQLRSGIGLGQLRLHYQPVIDLASEQVIGVEALVRWLHPTRGLLPPSEFIPLAERSGLVVDVGEWVLREACTALSAWEQDGRGWSVGVNLSPRQLVGVDFPTLVRRVLTETGASAGRLIIEVTESTVMDDPAAPEVLDALRLIGVRLALDDFGTGYSSLTYLRRFTVDTIKIDRSFVAGLGRDPDDDAIVASIVSLASAVGKLAVAEGVETVGQLQALRDLGVAQAQGFLWTRPLPPEQLEAWLVDRPQIRATSDVPQLPLPSADAPVVTPGSDEARILELHLQGASLHTVAAALNAEARRTAGGRRWTTTTVARVVADLVRQKGAARSSSAPEGRW